MAAGDKNYALGRFGVDVDSSPIHANPAALLKAQNAVRDPFGADGGLKKRLGLTKLNSGAGSGSILGGVPMPVFSYTDTRTLLLAKFDSTTPSWVTTNDLFATSSLESDIAAWQSPATYYSLAPGVCRMGVFYNGQLYYAASGYTPGTTSPTIRVYNGSDDRELCKILPATTLGVTGMFVSKGEIYVLTLDSGTTDADFVGSVYKLSTNGHLTKQGDSLTTGYVPTCIINYNDKLYVGASRLTTTNEARVLSLDPLSSTTAWATDATFDADDYQITGFASFRGLLYATTKNGGAATKGKIRSRSLAGSWSTVDSTVNNGGSYEDIVAWEGALYASSRNYSTTTSTGVVRKSTDGSSWSTVYNSATVTGLGIFTIIGLRLFTMGTTTLLHTTDGASWTSATPAGSANCDGVLGTLVVTDVQDFEEPVSESNAPTINVTNVTGLTSAQLPSYGVVFYSQNITIAEFRTLNSSPVTLLSSPGPGYAYIPIAMFLELDINGTFSGPTTVNLFYTGSSTGILTGISWSNASSRYQMYSGGFSNNTSMGGTSFHPADKAVLLGSNGDITSGSVNSDIRVTIAYMKVSMNG